MTDFRKQGVKVLIAIGGWNDSAGGKYSKLVNNPEARRRFTEHVIKFILENNFDGLDLDWEYPVCWQVCFFSHLSLLHALHSSIKHKQKN